MTLARLRLCRSLLFLPASSPRAIAKARTLPADLVILDCEDAVEEAGKADARAAAVQAVEEGFGERLVAIRINAFSSACYEADIAAVAASKADFVVVPKVRDGAQVEQLAAQSGKAVLAMIESAAGVLDARAIAAASGGLIAGTNDLGADLGLPAASGRMGLVHSLQSIVLAARAAGVPAFDGVYNRLADDEGLAAECREGSAFGFDGKSVIHPAQIETTNRIFSPTGEEVEAAQRLLNSARGGAQRFEGRMIEAMHVAQAEALLAKARIVS